MLHGLVAELIVPSVKTKDYDVRAQGLICLGLCCLLDKVSVDVLRRAAPTLMLSSAVHGARLVPASRPSERGHRRRLADQGLADAVRPPRPPRHQLWRGARLWRAFTRFSV